MADAEVKTKKRHRDSAQADGAERKHKRSKRHAADENAGEAIEGDEVTSSAKHEKKSKKSSKSKESRASKEVPNDPASDAEKDGDAKKSKKSSKKESRKSKHTYDEDADEAISEHPGVVVLNSARSKKFPDGKLARGRQYPFYTQTVSQYLPLRPFGISDPIQGYANQHLKPLLHRHVPSFGGVLLAYRRPRIGEAPGKGSLTEESGMEDMTLLESINEYAVSFGWLTVEIDLFRPSRGAWLEGLVNFQGEGHIGVVCWGKFNASIESGRLPSDWRWVDSLTTSNGDTDVTMSPPPAPEDDAEADPNQVIATGYWVDGKGDKITSDTPISFRIKNYEVGTSGDYGYLSIEGTMLPEEEEAEKVREEVQKLRSSIKRGSVLRRDRKPLLELSMTKFNNEDEKDEDRQRADE